MADNVVANAGSGGATFATDDIGGVHYPISKLGYGALDSITLVSAANGLPNAIVSASVVLPGADDTASLFSGTTALTPKFAVITASAAGDTQVVAAVTGKRILVLRFSVSAAGNVAVNFKSATPGAISGKRYLTQYASGGGAYCPVGICRTAVGEALLVTLDASVAVSGEVTYVEV